MIWENYVFRRGVEVEDLWTICMQIAKRITVQCDSCILRAVVSICERTNVISSYVERLNASGCKVDQATLLLVGFGGYQLSGELEALTNENASILEGIFGTIGKV